MSPYAQEIGGSHLVKGFNLVVFEKTLLKGSSSEEPMCFNEKANLPTRKVLVDIN
jgi:hypothetical protein